MSTKKIGRPPEVDENGEIVSKCLVNCTIPTKLRDFLAEHGVNRSELFRTAALKMFEHKICPSCYSENISTTYKGKVCIDCNRWLLFNTCIKCDTVYTPRLHGQLFNEEIICQTCYDKESESVEDFINTELMKRD